MDRLVLRSCVCDRPIHTYTLVPGVKVGNEKTWRLLPKACCRCPEDCLCHGGGPRKWKGAFQEAVEMDE